MKNEMKDKLVEILIDSLADEGLDNKEKRRVLQSACNKMAKLIKAGATGIVEKPVEETDSKCPTESIAFED